MEFQLKKSLIVGFSFLLLCALTPQSSAQSFFQQDSDTFDSLFEINTPKGAVIVDVPNALIEGVKSPFNEVH